MLVTPIPLAKSMSSLPSSSIVLSVDTCARPQVAEHESGGGDKGGGGEGGGEGFSGWQQPSQACGWSHITLAPIQRPILLTN